MDEFLSFLLENWRFLLEVILTIAILAIAIFKKKTKISTDGLNKVLIALPNYIREAEDIYSGSGRGKEKFEFVFSRALDDLKELYSDEVIKAHGFSIILSLAIENILDTPEKK